VADGPLSGMRILEFAGIGAAPFCAMLFSDLGADVVRVDRGRLPATHPASITERGRRSMILDLKSAAGVMACLAMIAKADALIEGFRPGVMERLGLGPQLAFARNPRLVYGRMTGWGQTGPLAKAAGHDINYIALSGALAAVGPLECPIPPLNLVGDFGGGALYLAFGLLAGILHARSTGIGQVVDAAMTDGAASLMSLFYGARAIGIWKDQRASNLIDGGAPFYGVYKCADGHWISLGAIEPGFYQLLLEKLGIPDSRLPAPNDPAGWPEIKTRLAAIILTKKRDEWCALLEGTDVCFAPVLDMAEAPHHPHNVARGTFVTLQGVVQPAPAPRFSATPGRIQGPPPINGDSTWTALTDWGVDEMVIDALKGSLEGQRAPN
jgi:alpha-methylacyl-CoA racemase